MYNYHVADRLTGIFETRGNFDFHKLAIQRPDHLPIEVNTKLSRYNEAIKRFDIREAEQAADEILEWLHCNGTAEPT